ncbi:carbohydrate ABC transporter substrate-binding protein, partial [Escherichia coli]|nr:carbohydrate ABC transporter substrate-binding protein [Escherichia coli]
GGKFVHVTEHEQNMCEWAIRLPGAARMANKAVATTASWTHHDVSKALGEAPNQVIGELANIQVVGAVGDKNFTRMGDVTVSGV